MTLKDLQEEMNKRFDELLFEVQYGTVGRQIEAEKKLKSFIQSEISLAVEQEKVKLLEEVLFVIDTVDKCYLEAPNKVIINHLKESISKIINNK